MRPLLRRSSNREGAQGMVEFALVLPLLLMLMFGLIEVGRMLFVYSMVSSSSREGARYGAAAGDVGGFVTHYEDCDGIRAAAERIGNFAGVSDGDISITYDRMDDSGNATTFASCNSGLTYDCEPNCGDSPYQKVKLGDRVIVSVSREFQPILPLVNLPSFPISSETYRTIVKDVQIEGTPQPAAANSPTVDFVPATQTVTEGDSGGTSVNITVQLSEPTGTGVVVNYTVSGEATLGEDFDINPSSKVTIAPGGDSATITVTVYGDAFYEDLESVVVTMGTVLGAIPGQSQAVVFIENNDPLPLVTFTQASKDYQENDGSDLPVMQYTITVETDKGTGSDIVVPFSFTPGSDPNHPASPVSDFSVSGASVTLPATNDIGIKSTATIAFTVVNDDLDEYDELVTFNLQDPPNADLGANPSHAATIIDDDDPPEVYFAIDQQYVAEPPATQSKTINVEVLLSAPSGKDVVVPFSVTGDATQGSDYNLSTTSPIEFSPLQQSASIDVVVLGDSDDSNADSVEDVKLTLGAPVDGNAVRVDPSVHTLTITDITVSFVQAASTYDESAGTADIVLQISSAPPTEVKVNLAVGGNATEGANADFTLSTHQVIFPAGSAASRLVTVTIYEDLLDEYDETVILSIGSTTIAAPALPDKHTLTITDNDDMPTVSFTSGSQTVSESVGAASVGLQLSAVSGRIVTVPVNLSGTATRGVDGDYTTDPSGMTFTFQPGETSKTLTFNINDDLLDEDDVETIVAAIALPADGSANVTVGGIPAHTVSINDNDAMPSVAFTVALQNGTEAVGTMSIGVRLSNPSARVVTVPYTKSGSADEGADYLISPSPIVIQPGELQTNIDITVIDDGDYESEENVLIDMGTPTNAVQGALIESEARITDNDPVMCQGFYTFDELNVDQLRIRARVLNASQADVQITGFALSWTDTSAFLSAISLDSVNIWTSAQPLGPPAFVSGGWTVGPGSLIIPANSTGTLVFDFTGVDLGELDFMFVYLDNTCTISHTQ